MKNASHKICSLLIVLTLLFSSFGAIHVYADDATPIPETTEEVPTEETTAEASPQAQATEEPVEAPQETQPVPTDADVTETAVAETEEATPEENDPAVSATAENTEQTGAEETAVPTGEANTTEEPTLEPTPMLSDEELDTLPEILKNVPAGTDVVVLDENGNAAPLASEEAAETMVEGDPIWCPDGQAPTPGLNGCTPSFTSFDALISELETGAYTGNGTIWVAYDYDATEDNDIILFYGNDPDLAGIANNNLTIQGGWSGTSGDTSFNTSTPSIIDVALVIDEWAGNITLSNIFINNTTDHDSGLGLFVYTDGDVILNDVEVSGTTGTANNLDGDGAIIDASGNVTINNSTFNDNDGVGLEAYADELTLNNVEANNNAYDGGHLLGATLLNVVDSNFNNNTGFGIDTIAMGTIDLTNTNANNNTILGALLDTRTFLGGNITVTGGEFSNNQNEEGLVIGSGGSTTVFGVTANNNQLNGVYIDSGISSTDYVNISNSTFSGNGAAGIDMWQDGDGLVIFDNVISDNNATGAIIYSDGTGNVNIQFSEFFENDFTGLHIESVGNIFINTIYAGATTTNGGNGANGAYLMADGTITIDQSYFNENANLSSGVYRGLYANAIGTITLTDVIANNNTNGAGAELINSATGNIYLSGGNQFNENGTYGVQATVADGQIIMNSSQANYNTLKGAYFQAKGTSGIIMNGDIFTGNGNYGVYATTEDGNITDGFSIYDGDNFTKTGAQFLSSNGGTILINGDSFSNMQGAGLKVITDGLAVLLSITVQDNGGNGSEVFSTFTVKKCYCPGDVNTSVTVEVNGGLFQSNGQYGLYVKPGDEGTVDLTTSPPTFITNNSGDYLIDTSPIPQCPCDCAAKPEGKPYRIVEAPFSGSGDIPQDCVNYAGTIIKLPDGTYAQVTCPFNGFSNLQGITEDDLPGVLGSDFDLGILLGLLGKDGSYVLNSNGTITLNFIIPETSRGRSHRLLFWDNSMNDGAGGWYQVPPYEVGSSFPLHPDDPDDTRLIISGVSQNGNVLSVTVNFAGYFVVASN